MGKTLVSLQEIGVGLQVIGIGLQVMLTLSTKLRNCNTPEVILSRKCQHFLLSSAHPHCILVNIYVYLIHSLAQHKYTSFGISFRPLARISSYLYNDKVLKKNHKKPYLFAWDSY